MRSLTDQQQQQQQNVLLGLLTHTQRITAAYHVCHRCWETLAQLTVKQNEPSQPLTPATSGSPEQRAAEEQPAGDEQAPSQPKRAPM